MRRTLHLWTLVLSLLPLISLFSVPACGQARENRLRGSLASNSRLVLSNSRVPQAETMQDMGAVPPQQIIAGITLVFNRSPEQEAELQKLLEQQQDAKSPLYHQWLTPFDFGERFGMTDSDLRTVSSWLSSVGFVLASTAPSRDRLTFTGTAAQVQTAFGAELHHYRVHGEMHVAPSSDLTIPLAMEGVAAAVLHLSDFRPSPSAQVRSKPAYTTLSAQTHYLTPGDLAVMYNFKGLGTGGQGQSIAVVGQSYVDLTDGAASGFLRVLGLQSGGLSSVLVPGSGVEAISPGDELESEIDVEYAAGTAQGAQVFLVYVGDQQNYNVFDALTFAIETDISPIISISYGSCESLQAGTELSQANALFAQAAAQGQTLIAASGDSGSTACAAYSSSSGLTATQLQALSINFPGDSPYVTAVGGTQMAAGTYTSGSSPYWADASGSDLLSSLLSYVPETAWNEGSATLGILAGGGGASTYFPRPSWQTGVPGIAAGAYRLVPDLALQSSIASPGYLVCSDDPIATSALGAAAGSCLSSGLGSGISYPVAGGTSFAAPVFAGMVAILNNLTHSAGQGAMNPALYELASNSSTYAAAFHDITSGSNACIPSAANCVAAGEAGYSAGIGYDEATGLGSLDLAALIHAWPVTNAPGGLISSTLVAIPVYTAASGASLAVTIVVNSSGTASPSVPTGTLSVSVNGVVVNGALAFSSTDTYAKNATAVYTFVTPSLAGSYFVTARYSGDATYAPSAATASVLVGNVVAAGGFSLAAGGLTVANNSQGRTAVTLTPNNGYNGRVLWSLTSSGSTALAACYLIQPLTANGVSTESLVIGVGTACNAPLTAQRREAGRPLEQMAQTGPGSRKPLRPLALTLAGLLLCGFQRRKSVRRGLPVLLSAALLMVVTLGVSGCGGSSPSTANPVTPTPPVASAATYTLTLKGQDSVNTTITSSTTFTLTVQ